MWSLPPSRPISRPNRKRPAGRGTSMSRLSAPAKRPGARRFEPDLVAAAIVAARRGDGHRDQAGRGRGRHDDAFAARRMRAFMVQGGGDRNVLAVGQGDEIGRLDAERRGDPVQPADRDGAGAGLEPADRLRRGRRVAAVGDVLQGHLAGAADLADAGDHEITSEPDRLVLSYSFGQMASAVRCATRIWRNRLLVERPLPPPGDEPGARRGPAGRGSVRRGR